MWNSRWRWTKYLKCNNMKLVIRPLAVGSSTPKIASLVEMFWRCMLASFASHVQIEDQKFLTSSHLKKKWNMSSVDLQWGHWSSLVILSCRRYFLQGVMAWSTLNWKLCSFVSLTVLKTLVQTLPHSSPSSIARSGGVLFPSVKGGVDCCFAG